MSDKHLLDSDYLTQLEHNKNAIDSAYRNILSEIDFFLPTSDFACLSHLLAYMKDGDGILACQYIGKTIRYRIALEIVATEHQFHMTLFSSGCSNHTELWSKYMSSVFCFRRILFSMSDASVTEAIDYLHEHVMSPIAAYCILQNELPSYAEELQNILSDIFSDFWSPKEMESFAAFFQTMRCYHE